jgi:hypothetical protein
METTPHPETEPPPDPCAHPDAVRYDVFTRSFACTVPTCRVVWYDVTCPALPKPLVTPGQMEMRERQAAITVLLAALYRHGVTVYTADVAGSGAQVLLDMDAVRQLTTVLDSIPVSSRDDTLP